MALKPVVRLMMAFMTLTGLNSCGNSSNEGDPTDTRTTGTIHISADESFKPVLDSEIQVFESLNPGSKIIAHYKPEAECFKDFKVDSIRMVLATRGYSEAEKRFMNDSLQTVLMQMVVARDAVAVILHPDAKDSTFTLQELRDILTGKSTKTYKPVFDGLRATSTVRYVMDSLLKGDKFSADVRAVDSSQGVIDYVSKHPEAIGFIGVSWVGNPQDSTRLSYLSKVRVAGLQSVKNPDVFVTPAQYNIYFKKYPLVRELFYVLKERHNGLGHGFSNFLTTTSGQLIFNRAYLMPAMMDFSVRDAEITQ